MDLAAHFRVIAQNWLRILIISAALAVAVFIGSGLQSDTFQAQETLTVRAATVAPGESEKDAASFLAQTYAKYVGLRIVLVPALRDSKLSISLSELATRVSAAPDGDLGFLTITGTGPSRREAETVTKATSDQLVQAVKVLGESKRADILDPIRRDRKRLQQQLAALPPNSSDAVSIQLQLAALDPVEADALRIPIDSVNPFSLPISSDQPVAPKPARDALLAFLIALVAVSELTVLAHYVGDRFSGAEDSSDVAALTGLPVLAKIPRGEGIEVTEAFRVLRTNLMVLEGAGKPRTVAIVSANQSAGKTFTATHLAESAATLEEKVVLVDADLRKPAVHERLGIPRAPGLSSVLQGGDLTAALTKVPDNAYLRVLPSGAAVQDPSAVLGARSFRHVLDALRAVRLVIVDTPPANLFADAMAVASQCDATIFILDAKTSRRRAVRQSLEALERAGANLIGVVINRASVQKTASYYEG